MHQVVGDLFPFPLPTLCKTASSNSRLPAKICRSVNLLILRAVNSFSCCSSWTEAVTTGMQSYPPSPSISLRWQRVCNPDTITSSFREPAGADRHWHATNETPDHARSVNLLTALSRCLQHSSISLKVRLRMQTRTGFQQHHALATWTKVDTVSVHFEPYSVS